MDKLRSSVRPVVTFLVILALIAAFIFLIVKFSNQDIANKLIDSFTVLVVSVVSYWFGSRTPNTPNTPKT